MGSQKRQLERDEDKRQIAITIAEEAGALDRCEVHDYPIEGKADPVDAYRLAASLFREKDPRVADFATQRELTDLIKSVIADANSECPAGPACKGIGRD